MKKSAFSNAGGDGYFGVGGYVKKQDDASKGQYLRKTKDGKLVAGDMVTKEEMSAAFDASKAFGDKYSEVLNNILLESDLSKSDIKGKTTEEIAKMLGNKLSGAGESFSSKVAGMMRSYINAAKKLKKKEE